MEDMREHIIRRYIDTVTWSYKADSANISPTRGRHSREDSQQNGLFALSARGPFSTIHPRLFWQFSYLYVLFIFSGI